VEIIPQLVIEEQLKPNFAPKLVEEEKLQQPMSIGEEFFQKLFEKDLFILLFLNAKN
jgi:hypothetical protein